MELRFAFENRWDAAEFGTDFILKALLFGRRFFDRLLSSIFIFLLFHSMKIQVITVDWPAEPEIRLIDR